MLQNLRKCENDTLDLGSLGSPVFLSTTFPNPDVPDETLVGFNYGFLFTAPTLYERNDYCVTVSGADETLEGVGSFAVNSGQEISLRRTQRRRSFFGFSFCVIAMTDNGRMINLTGDIITAKPGTCAPEY